MQKKRQIRVALVASKNMPGKIDTNLENHIRWIERAVSCNVDFIGFPECSLTGYLIDKNIAIDIRGKEMKTLEDIARKKKIHISAGLLERKGRFFYNSHAVFGPLGLLGIMRKINLTPGEQRNINFGESLPVFDIGCAKFGIAICADSNGPEIPRILSFNGAEIIFTPYATCDYSNKTQSAKKFENGKSGFLASQCCAFFIACNNAGRFEKKIPGEEYLQYSSGSVMFNPKGEVIASSKVGDNREVFVVADIDLSAVDKARENSYSFCHFRPERFYRRFLRNSRRLADATDIFKSGKPCIF